MTFGKSIKLFVLPALLLIVIGFTACESSEGKDSSKEPVKRSISVEVQKIKGENYVDYINVLGTLKPIEKATLSYLPGGIIKEFVIDKGNYANKGEVIAIIDNDVIKANLDGAKAQYDLAQVTFEKQETIFKDKINSEFQMLEAKFRRDQAKANYELVKAQYEDTFIKAPFSGMVDAKYYEAGELAAPGTPIVNLINTKTIKIEAGVPERYIGQFKIGASVKGTIKSVSNKEVVGKLVYVGSSVITQNRTFVIEVIVNNDDQKLKPELVADLYIESGRYENIMSIPDEVVSRTDNGYSVFVVKDGVAENRVIEILERSSGKIAIKSGLNEGEDLVVVGYQNLIHGQKVNIEN